MTVHRPLLREIRALAEEYPSAEECLEAAVSRGLLPESATSDGHRAFVSSDGKRLETFIAWASLGLERIATAEALAAEFHRKADGAELPLRNIVWCIGGPLELGDDPAEAELVEMGLCVTLGINGQDVTLHMPWRSSVGVPAIDSLLGGLYAGTLIVISGPPGAYKSTIATMIAAGSTQQGRLPYYGSAGNKDSFNAVDKLASAQGFDGFSFRRDASDDARLHIENFDRSRCDVLIIDNEFYRSRRDISDVCEDAKFVARRGGRVSVVTVYGPRSGANRGDVGFTPDVILSTNLSGGTLTVTMLKNRYGDMGKSVRFTRGVGGRLVWDRTPAVASRRSLV